VLVTLLNFVHIWTLSLLLSIVDMRSCCHESIGFTKIKMMLPEIILRLSRDLNVIPIHKAFSVSKIRSHCCCHIRLLDTLEVKVMTSHFINLILKFFLVGWVWLLTSVYISHFLS